MNQIDAVFQNGVFKPIDKVHLREIEQVRLYIDPVARPDILAWLAKAKQLQAEIIARRGVLPGSAPDIAENRLRDI